jgi:glycerol uptake facilitator-like aquaporin
MASVLVESLAAFLQDWIAYIPPGLGLTAATAFIEGGKYFQSFRHEFVGTLLMIACTFSAGKWFGQKDRNVAWIGHAIGVIVADLLGGGPQVNPAMTMAMWALGKVTYTDAYVRVAGQLAGGLVAFPLYHAISDSLKLEPFGGPEFTLKADAGHAVLPFLSEYSATLLLCFAIYILNWELNFGRFHYIIKQTLTAVVIRALIESFPTTGPAMNPMLATTWSVFGVGTSYEYPSDFSHYFVYWVAPFLAAITSAFVWTLYAGGSVFGCSLPVGPIKTVDVAASKKKD